MRTVDWLVIGGVLALSPIALAQEPNPYQGTWKATMVNKKGETRKGEVILKDKDGTWDIDWQNPSDPCAGLRSPVTIQRTSADELVFEINRSKALKGCKDSIVIMKRVDDTTLKGALGDGRKLTLVRH